MLANKNGIPVKTIFCLPYASRVELKTVIGLIFLVCILISGCGPGPGMVVKKGDVFITNEILQVSVEIRWEHDTLDGFSTDIPKGTKLEVLYTPATTALGFECLPVEVNGLMAPGAIEAFFIPDSIRNKIGYVSFLFTINKEYVGSKIGKMKKPLK